MRDLHQIQIHRLNAKGEERYVMQIPIINKVSDHIKIKKNRLYDRSITGYKKGHFIRAKKPISTRRPNNTCIYLKIRASKYTQTDKTNG